jgi:uncharacterized phage protein gp47/JayE
MIYPLATLAPTINSTGISAPQYSDIYQSLIASFQTIYGTDIYISADSQDGQWLAVIAKAINDSNQAAIAVFQSYSPLYAQGAGLSSQVKLNGLARLVATNSQSQGNVVGQVGSIITNGVVADVNGNLWNLPATVTIPISGSISVTVTAQNKGAIFAPSGTINSIFNPQLGWQTFVSTVDATVGAPIESDATLRQRQGVSTALPAQTIVKSIAGSIGNVTGVQRFHVYENDTGITDVNGIPAHSLSAVVSGGASVDIGNAIRLKKPPGIQTYGTTPVIVYDSAGLPVTINYFILGNIEIYISLTIKALPGYVATTGVLIIASIQAYLNALSIGQSVYPANAQAVASLPGSGLESTFYITALTLGTAPAPTGTTLIAIAFNQAAVSTLSTHVVLTVT